MENEDLRWFHLSNHDEHLIMEYLARISKSVSYGVATAATRALQVSRGEDLKGQAETVTVDERGPTTGKFIVGPNNGLCVRHSSGSE